MRLVLADCICSIMAADTVIDDACVVKCCWYPTIGRVACVAVIACLQMRSVLPGCNSAIVTR